MRERSLLLDASRALFLVQGVILHASLPYSVGSTWLVVSPDSVVGVAPVLDWIHSYRMQGFFLISGILSWRVLAKRSLFEYLRTRTERLLIPLVFMLLTFNQLEAVATNRYALSFSGASPLRHFPVWSHLWFIVFLSFFAAFLPLVRVCYVRFSTPIDRLWRNTVSFEAKLLLFIMAYGVASVAISRTSPEWWWHEHMGMLHPVRFLLYSSYFFAGAIIAQYGRVELLATRPSALWLIGVVLGWAVIVAFERIDFPGAFTLLTLLQHVYALAALRVIFFLVSRALAPERADCIRVAVDASYTVYLLHHGIVVYMSLLFLSFQWPAAVEMSIVFLVALILPFLLHRHVVSTSPIFTLLFNGARRSKQAPSRT